MTSDELPPSVWLEALTWALVAVAACLVAGLVL